MGVFHSIGVDLFTGRDTRGVRGQGAEPTSPTTATRQIGRLYWRSHPVANITPYDIAPHPVPIETTSGSASIPPSDNARPGGWEDGLDGGLLRRRRAAWWRMLGRPSTLPSVVKRLVARGLERLGWRLIRRPGASPRGRQGVDPAWLAETHHGAYGRPWCLGRDQLDFLIARGLEPGHRVLDFGCGSLRAGIWLIDYLDVERYFGLDAHRPSLEIGLGYEIPLHGLEGKHPRLLHDETFEVGHFGVDFDWVMAFSVFNHLTAEQGDRAVGRIVSHLAPGGRLVTSHAPPLDEESLRQRHGLVRRHHESWPCQLAEDSIAWFEYQRVDEADRSGEP